MLNYTEYPSTPQVHLPHPSITISSSRLSPASTPPWRRVNKWGIRPHFFLWPPVASCCTPLWSEVPWLTFPQPPGGITTPALPACCRYCCDSPSCPVMEPLQDLKNITCHHPDLTDVQYHRLRHKLIHHPMGPYRCSCIFQNPQNHPPLPSLFTKLLIYRGPITLVIGDCASEVRKGL